MNGTQLSLAANPMAWNRYANMVFLEQPVGVGFSYADAFLSQIDFGDLLAAIDNTRVVRKFFEKFPERKKNDFYLASESYGGHYIPQWALRVLADDVLNDKFKGVLVGNPFVNLGSIFAGGISALWGMQLVPLPLWEGARKHGCADFARDAADYPEICFGVYDHMFAINAHINPYALNYPICPGFSLSGKGGAGGGLTQQTALLSKLQAIVSARSSSSSSSSRAARAANAATSASATRDIPSATAGDSPLPRAPPAPRKTYRDNSNEPGFDFEPCTESWVIGRQPGLA
jgi:hypothetical protein